MGALALLVAGVGALFTAKWLHTRVLVLALVAAAPAYMFLRATGIWSGDSLVALSSLVHERRGQSLQSRITNDGMLVERALQKPVFGWGGWGRARVYEEDWKGDLVDVAVTDGLWIIALGNTGLVGLTAITAAMLLPAALVLYRLPKRTWWQPTAAPAVVLATLVVLYALDNLFNAMLNPIYVVTAGALTNLCLVIRVAAAAPLAAQQARVWPAVPAGPDARYVAATGRRRKPVTKTL